MRRLAMFSVLSLFFGRAAGAFPEPADLPKKPALPDPLVMLDGTKVTTREQWTEKRRTELKALFQHYMYGTIPTARLGGATVPYTNTSALGGKATVREFVLRFEGLSSFRLLVVTPNGRKGRVPCFVGPNFGGNHAALDDPDIALPTAWMYPNRKGVEDNRATDKGRGSDKDVWNIPLAIDRGYAVATFYPGEIDPDRADARGGLRTELFKDLDTSTIACWAWGVSRAVDQLVKLTEIDAKRIIAVGHSRLGKTVLLAAAFDERIAAAIPHQAGCGGTAPSRGTVGESVKQINDRFPHWFNARFKEFNADPTRLPFDQNGLVALCAPRPVLFSNAQEDQWANPNGQFEVLKAADPVYRFLGAGGLDVKEVPPPGKVSPGTLGYFIRPGKHSMTREDWQAFLDFADSRLGKP
ncbi:MAG TPA: acetylxylan esterase [Gemmataceae bacterium]|nr:acetylxylan esterase [Gemmataceae bacterium]HVK09044.1 acetylxylan esterase [Gemmataceae bacterium]